MGTQPNPAGQDPLAVRHLAAPTPSVFCMEWDAENRLTAVKQGGNTLASFTYDGNGRRATKAAGGVTTTYVYDGSQFLEERPSTGSTKRHVYGPGIDQPLAQVVGGTTTYNVADHLGSIVRTTDSLGTPIPTLTRQYDPWGNPVQGSATSGYAFTGREWDAETGLYYYRARYYSSPLGRFLSEDIVRTADSLYAYAQNRPVEYKDPSGQSPGKRFKLRDQAVLDAYEWLNAPVFLDWEYGGHVCQDSNKCYFCTLPTTDGLVDRVNPDKSPCPAGTKDKGEYHTHPLGLSWVNGVKWSDQLRIDDHPDPEYAGYVWLIGRRKLFGLDGRVFRYDKNGPTTGTPVGTVVPNP